MILQGSRSGRLTFALLVLPALGIMLALTVWPLANGVVMSFTNASPLQPRTIFLIDDLKRVLPARRLRRVQFAQMQHLALHHPTGMHAQALA